MLGLINRTIFNKQPSTLLRLYKSLVHPHLEYCSPAWSSKYVKDKELLERMQHQFTHFFKDLQKLDYTERLQRFGLWTLEGRCNRADVIEVYKIVNCLSTLPTSTFFEFWTDTWTWGHSLKLSKKRPNKDLRLHFFPERVVNRWNNLLASAIEATSVNSFKACLQKVRAMMIGFFMDTASVWWAAWSSTIIIMVWLTIQVNDFTAPSHCRCSGNLHNTDAESSLLCILTYNDRTVTHLHIKWGVALGPIVVGAGTRHLPPSRIHAPVTNPR